MRRNPTHLEPGGKILEPAPETDEGTLVVNVGDLLMRWSNDVFRSTPHRVINRQSCERYSMVVAWDPDFDTLIDPSIVCADQESALYLPIRCGEYVLSRFDASFSYRN